MEKHYYDDFCRKTLKDMAQSISDMTYTYKDTMVPASHYQSILSKSIDELASQDINIELNLMEPYYKMLADLKKESPKYFVKALIMLEMGVKPSTISTVEMDAVNFVYREYENKKPKDRKLLNDFIIDDYKVVSENGISAAIEEIEYSDDSDHLN